ncbi:MAG: histidine kinase [Gammaproteobacteria bacterium]|nr:histidine kinase [Gammaproteobacteria bacterium]
MGETATLDHPLINRHGSQKGTSLGAFLLKYSSSNNNTKLMKSPHASPNFLRLSNLLVLLLCVQILVFVFWLISDNRFSLASLGLYSIYSLWLVVISVIMSEFAFRLFDIQSNFVNSLIWILSCSVAVFTVECFTAYVQSNSTSWLPSSQRLFRFWLADMLVLLILARGWVFFQRVKQLDRAESDSRMLALQARIQPHFLFNSLNTIAELTASMPEQAEEAIHSLAMLFRVSLENQEVQHSLKKELTLCKRFISLESWRFSGGIPVEYDVSMKSTSRWQVPKLLLQPLVENAIKYGSPRETGVPIKIKLTETKNTISVKIVNAISEKERFAEGNGVALDNIRDRLDALYDDKYTFSSRDSDGIHYLLIQIPKEKVE